MNKDQVSAARDFATEVINGFRCTSVQLARYSVSLANECDAKDVRIAALERKVLALELIGIGAAKRAPQNMFDEIFGTRHK